MECIVFTCELGIWLEGGTFAAQAVRNVVTFFGSCSHVASASQCSLPVRKERIIFSAPSLIAPVTIIYLRKKTAFHL